MGDLHILSGDPPEIIDFDLSKAQHLNVSHSPFSAKVILQAGKELAEVLKGGFFGPTSRIAKYGTAVEQKHMQDTCWLLSVVTRQFKYLTQGLPDFKGVANQLDVFNASEKRLIEDLVREAERKRAFETAKMGFALIWKAIKALPCIGG